MIITALSMQLFIQSLAIRLKSAELLKSLLHKSVRRKFSWLFKAASSCYLVKNVMQGFSSRGENRQWL